MLKTILPLNACGFIGLALLPQSPVTSAGLSGFLALAAVAFFLSALLRAGSLRADDQEDQRPFFEALLAGGFESAITITAALTIAALMRRFSGTGLKIALLMEGEFLVLAGLALGRRYLRLLGGTVLSSGLWKIFLVDAPQSGTREWLGRSVHFWTPSALLTAGLYYLNRAITGEGRLYTWGGAALLALILLLELPHVYIGLSWMVLGALILLLWRRWPETKWQAAFLLPAGYLGLMTSVGLLPLERPTLWVGFAGFALLCALTTQLWREHRLAWQAPACAAATVVLALAWLARAMPERAVVLGWGALALVLVELGAYLPWRWLRQMAWSVAAAATFAGFYGLSLANEVWFGIPYRYVAAVPVIASLFYLAERTRELDAPWSALYQYLATPLALALLGEQVGYRWTAAAWGAWAVGLVLAGLWTRDGHLRLQGYLVLGASWLVALVLTSEDPRRVWRALPVIAALYLVQFLTARRPFAESPVWLRLLDKNIHWVSSSCGTLLLSVLLYFEISGQRLTMAWGLQGVALLVVGFMARERVLRLAGLTLFLLCIAKLFLYDLRNLETLSRILSFIVLGLLLLGASWIYTRFRDQVRRLL